MVVAVGALAAVCKLYDIGVPVQGRFRAAHRYYCVEVREEGEEGEEKSKADINMKKKINNE